MIDFYAGKAPPGSSMPVAMHLDVRPALDSFDVRHGKSVKRCCTTVVSGACILFGEATLMHNSRGVVVRVCLGGGVGALMQNSVYVIRHATKQRVVRSPGNSEEFGARTLAKRQMCRPRPERFLLPPASSCESAIAT